MRSDTLRTLAATALLVARAAIGAPAGAQSHFPAPPDHSVFTRYTIPEECLSAVTHSVDSVRWLNRRDTLPDDPGEPLPPAAVTTARQCLAQFTVTKVDTVSLRPLRDVAIAANEDSVAAAAVAREYANNRTLSPEVRGQVLVDAVRANLDAHPARLDAAGKLIKRIDALGPQASVAQLQAHGAMISYLQREPEQIDRIMAETKAYQYVVEHVPPEIRAADTATWTNAEQFMKYAQVAMTELRDGPAAGLAEMKARGWIAGTVLGQRAPAISGAYWFNRADSTQSLPRPGKVSIVVFVDALCGERCMPYQATMRRLARAHPEVEFTLVAQTRGYYRGILTTRAADEAELNHRYLSELRQLPGALAVDSTPFTRFTVPDNRRVEATTRNALAYQLVAGANAVNLHPGGFYECFVIGPDGVIDFTGTMAPENEKMLLLQIGAIERSTGASSATP